MAASVGSDQSSNKLNVELNLVPFIDLLSSLVLFLLITAVWLQISAIPASVSSHGKSAVSAMDSSRLSVRLTDAGYELSWPAGFERAPRAIPKTGGAFDLEHLAAAVSAATKSAKLPGVVVAAEDGVPYGNVIEAVDGLKTSAGTAVAMSTE